MADDIFEVKPGIGPVKINLVALWKRFFSKTKEDSVTIVARRFVQVFQDHGVPVPQIPRLVPQIALEMLRSPDTLLPALKADVLEHTANMFLIRKAWLEGIHKRSTGTNQPAGWRTDYG